VDEIYVTTRNARDNRACFTWTVLRDEDDTNRRHHKAMLENCARRRENAPFQYTLPDDCSGPSQYFHCGIESLVGLLLR
jgi:hypothetical protein